MNKKYMLFINYCVTAVLLYVVFSRIPFAGVMQQLRGADFTFIIIALIVSLFFRLAYHPWLWKKVFDAANTEVSLRDMVLVNAVSLPLKYILPFKITEIARPAGLKILGKVSFPLALGASMLLKLAILLATVSLLLLGSIMIGNMNAFTLSAFGIIALVLIIFSMNRLPQQIFGFNVRDISHCFLNSTPEGKARVYIFSLAMQAGEVITSYLIIRAFGALVPLTVLVYSVSLMMLFSMIPFSIQGIGVRETVAVALLGTYISPDISLAAGVMITIVHHILPAVVGAFVWVFDSTSRSFSFKAAVQ